MGRQTKSSSDLITSNPAARERNWDWAYALLLDVMRDLRNPCALPIAAAFLAAALAAPVHQRRRLARATASQARAVSKGKASLASAAIAPLRCCDAQLSPNHPAAVAVPASAGSRSRGTEVRASAAANAPNAAAS